MSGLFADLELGFGTVALTDEITQLPRLRRQRILRDWSIALKTEADRGLVELFRETSASTPGRSIVQQVEHFKRSCKAQEIHCPTDFALLLQQYE